MNFFQKKEIRVFFNSCINKMQDEITRLSDAEITSCNLQKWADHFAAQYYVAPISLFEANIEKSISKIKIKKQNPYRGAPDAKDYFEVDGVRITFKIPFDGTPELFACKTNYYVPMNFTTSCFEKPYGENCGSFTLDLEYTNQELQEKNEAMSEYVQKQFDLEFSYYKDMIRFVNAEVNSYNDNLKASALQLLKERKKKADSLSAISSALKIPLAVSKNAPNTKPIHLKRISRRPSAKPSIHPIDVEPYISDSDYENINNIISMCGTTMEKTARTYFANTEEELRDHLIATLNTHYDAVTGETFRKLGKTDIHIEFDNKAAFIGECKIWHGIKQFQNAVQQVINYSTWRDLKISVIIFNKENRSFQQIITEIKRWTASNTASCVQPQANIWKCQYRRQDMNVDIQLTILAFDLYVDRSQFKDRRYNN